MYKSKIFIGPSVVFKLYYNFTVDDTVLWIHMNYIIKHLDLCDFLRYCAR